MVDGLEGFERGAQFPTTSWSAIVNARSPGSEVSREALGRLCSSYWYSVFAFIRRKGLESDQARDCTQDFFTTLLEKEYLADIDRSKGRFRSFLLAAVSHFVNNWFDAQKAQKRGGGRQLLSLEPENSSGVWRNEPANSLTPEALFEYQWAANLLDRTLKRLRAAYRGPDFDVLKPFLIGDAARGGGAAAAEQLGMSQGAFKVAVHRLKKRYRQALQAEILETVSDPGQVDDEIRYLLRVLAQGEGTAV
jgi:RNA polymerase sigma-70 factor (ECF subfamily)